MDPATAIGVASSVIAFLDFSIEIVSGAWEIYKSLDGQTSANAHVSVIVADFENASASLCVKNKYSKDINGEPAIPLSENERAILDLSDKCHAICVQLREALLKLTRKHKTVWASLKTAWLQRRKQSDIVKLHANLREYRSAIMLRLLQVQVDYNQREQIHNQNLDELIQQLLDKVNKQVDTEKEINARICGRILKQLEFASIYRRDNSIVAPSEGTYSWIVREEDDTSSASASDSDSDSDATYDSNSAVGGHDGQDDRNEFMRISEAQHDARGRARAAYMAWLGYGASEPSNSPDGSPSSHLHISGKAGSGKSTMMRYLFRHERTLEGLQDWAEGQTLICASFYFWVAGGDSLQMSLDGLQRSILYKVLQQQPPLAPELFTKQWQLIRDRIERREDDSSGNADAALFHDDNGIEHAFKRLLKKTRHNTGYRFCFFIDGLDEYRADYSSSTMYGGTSITHGFRELAKDILGWSRGQHVKICTSSRPYPEFNSLNNTTVLAMDSVNECDIYQTVKTKFREDVDFGVFKDKYLNLAYTITQKAEGVYLWALLTVRVLIKSLSRGDTEAILNRKLNEVPVELDDVYTMLLSHVDKGDQERCNLILLIAIHGTARHSNFDSIWATWLDDLPNPSFPETATHVEHYTDVEILRRRKHGRDLTASLTYGLIEFAKDNKARDGYSEGAAYFHRTAYDYLVEREQSGKLASPLCTPSGMGDVFDQLFLASYVYLREPLHETIGSLRMEGSTPMASIMRLADARQACVAAACHRPGYRSDRFARWCQPRFLLQPTPDRPTFEIRMLYKYDMPPNTLQDRVLALPIGRSAEFVLAYLEINFAEYRLGPAMPYIHGNSDHFAILYGLLSFDFLVSNEEIINLLFTQSCLDYLWDCTDTSPLSFPRWMLLFATTVTNFIGRGYESAEPKARLLRILIPPEAIDNEGVIMDSSERFSFGGILTTISSVYSHRDMIEETICSNITSIEYLDYKVEKGFSCQLVVGP